MRLKLITPPGLLFTIAVSTIVATYAFLIGITERSMPLLIGGVVAVAACIGTALLKPWSRFLVYLLTGGFLAKLTSSIHDGLSSGFFDFQFDSAKEALRSLGPTSVMALLSVSCCFLMQQHFRIPKAANPGPPPASTSTEGTAGWGTRQYSNEYLWLLGTIIALACGQWLQSNVLLNHDVAWIGHSARWLLEGSRFGREVYDYNLPMIWLLSTPAAVLVKSGLLNEPDALRAVFWGYFLVSALITGRLLTWLDDEDRIAGAGWRFAFLLMATLAAGASFGQREYLCVLFSIPYLALSALRLQRSPRVNVAWAVAIGLLAGIGFSIKPYFLAVPVCIEAVVVFQLGIRPVLRAENVAIATTLALYVASILLLMPDYVRDAFPLAQATYWAFESPSLQHVLVKLGPAAKVAALALFVSLLTRSWSRLATVSLAAGVGFLASYVVQAKGFVYHQYPVLFCATLLAASILAQGAAATATRASRLGPVGPVVAVMVLLLGLLPVKWIHDETLSWYAAFNTNWGRVGLYRLAVVEAVNHYASRPGSHFYALSTHPFPGFPTGSYTRAEWSGSACCQLAVPAIARIREVTNPELRQRIHEATSIQVEMVVDDLMRTNPEVVLVERGRSRLGLGARPFDDVAFYMRDPRFQAIWKHYRETVRIGSISLFVRSE
jgi:hypothetical protein